MMAKTLFRNAQVILDGHSSRQGSLDVLVDDDRIVAVGPTPISSTSAKVVDVGGRTLMPGLIDAHAHITGLSLSPKNRNFSATEIALAAADYLRNALLDGFTTLREAGGADFTIAQLVATGQISGPRLFYSGRALTQTGGGADFRTPRETTDPSGHPGPYSVMSVITDGVDEVRRAAREELRKGASQLKVFVSGGVVFPAEGHPTVHEFSLAELGAIVEEAAARSTYVMAHVYTDEGVRRCLQCGVRSIEHANFASEETVAMIAEHRAFLDLTFISLIQRIESAPITGLAPSIVANLERTVERGKQVYAWARKHKVPIALGTDLWGPDARQSQAREFAVRAEFDEPGNVIHSATVVNAELLQRAGHLGVIAVGAYADLLVVEGDPLKDLRLLADPKKKLKLVMKGGEIYKNELLTS
jgi:imidazolonepropionase-like amidohydrolase